MRRDRAGRSLSRPIERGLAGLRLLAHVLVSKYADHQLLYRQAEIYACEGVELERSTLSDWVGACAELLAPLNNALLALPRDDMRTITPVRCSHPFIRSDRPPLGSTGCTFASLVYTICKLRTPSESGLTSLSNHESTTLCAMDYSASGTYFQPGAGRVGCQIFVRFEKVGCNY